VAVATTAVFRQGELGIENSRIGGKYGRWKNEEERVFYLYNSKNAAHTTHSTLQPTQRFNLHFLALTA
jgi:hypothetical protein